MNFRLFKYPLFSIFCGVVILIHFFQILYFERSFFTTPYDELYWKDRYEHSQYGLPLSQRIIGDDGVYAYIGYKLIQGWDPSIKDAQVPPIGKYLIGLSILVFNNPAYYALSIGIGCLVVFFLLSHYLLKDKIDAMFVPVLLSLDPLFFTQLWKSWIDITQLFFLLLNIISLTYMQKPSYRKETFFALISGFSLGLFAETKIAVLLPIIFVPESIYFLFKGFKKAYIFFLVGICGAVLLSYIKYFVLGHSLFDFFKLQKYIASFWLQSKLVVHNDALWQIFFFGKFPDVVTGYPGAISEWWIIWPLFAVLGISFALYGIFSKKYIDFWKIISLFMLGSLVIYTIIPSYPRYLVVLLPFLYILGVKMVSNVLHQRIKLLLFCSILLYGLVHATLYLTPRPDGLLKTFYYSFSHQYFQDIYEENIAETGKPGMSGEEFRLLAQKTLNDAQVRAITVGEPQFIDKETIRFNVVYKTQDLGSFEEQKTAKLVQEHGRWKLVWDWDLLLTDFSPDSTVETKVILGKRGSLLNPQGQVLAEDGMGIIVSVNSQKIDTKREFELLKFLESYSHQSAISLQNAYLENSLPGEDVPLVTFHTPLNEKEKSYLVSFPGVTLREYPSRIFKGIDQNSIKNTQYAECCTHIYSSYNYHGVAGAEKEFDEKLWGFSGGEIIIKDKEGKLVRTVLEKTAKNGEDITL